jgi:hypothetical protein
MSRRTMTTRMVRNQLQLNRLTRRRLLRLIYHHDRRCATPSIALSTISLIFMGYSRNKKEGHDTVPLSPSSKSHEWALQPNSPRSHVSSLSPRPDGLVSKVSAPPLSRPSILNSSDLTSLGLSRCRTTDTTLNEQHYDKSLCHIQSLTNDLSNEDLCRLSISAPSCPVLPSAGRTSTLIHVPDDRNESSSCIELSTPQLSEVSAPPRSSSSVTSSSDNHTVRPVPSVAESVV